MITRRELIKHTTVAIAAATLSPKLSTRLSTDKVLDRFDNDCGVFPMIDGIALDIKSHSDYNPMT